MRRERHKTNTVHNVATAKEVRGKNNKCVSLEKWKVEVEIGVQPIDVI